jgi:hypothetical protein
MERLFLLILGLVALAVSAGLLVLLIRIRKATATFFAIMAGLAVVVALGMVLLGRGLGVTATAGLKLAVWLGTTALAVMLVVGVIGLVWRFFAWLGAADPAGAAVNPEERQRILGMVEQGKMTGPEGTELLDALGKSSALRGQQTFSRLDVMMLVGIAATVLGFFLPWLWVPCAPVQGCAVREVTGSGCGVVGWGMLFASGLAAALVFITPKEYLYKLLLLQVLCIFVGLALASSVWIGNATIADYGVIICVAGFAIALIASGMKLRALGR